MYILKNLSRSHGFSHNNKTRTTTHKITVCKINNRFVYFYYVVFKNTQAAIGHTNKDAQLKVVLRISILISSFCVNKKQ